jgi:hypothetical protein
LPQVAKAKQAGVFLARLGEPVSGVGFWDYDIESVDGVTTMRGRIGQERYQLEAKEGVTMRQDKGER